MIGNIRLYKSLGLKQDNTMYFASLQDQQTFFNAPPNVQFTDYEDVSYNGSRAFKININFVSFMFLEYDYLRFEFPNGDGTTKTIYAFINDITYVNDNCCAIQSTIDLMQTFMFEIFNSYKYGVVKNYTLKQNDFKTYLPYTNKYPVSDYKIEKGIELTPKKEDGLINCGWVLVTLDPSFDDTNVFKHYCYDNGMRIPFIKLAIPIVLSYLIDDSYTFQVSDGGGGQTKIIQYSRFVNTAFYKKIAPYILDISICTTQIADEYFSSSTLENRISLTFTDTVEKHFELKGITGDSELVEYLIPQVISNASNEYKYEIPASIRNNFNIARLPYSYIKIGNGFSSVDVNLLDFVGDMTLLDVDNYLHITLLTSLTFPTQATLSLNLYDGNDFIPINTPLIIGASENVIYSTSAWSTYVSQNRQYANMGLATQQQYEKQVFEKQISSEKAQLGIKTASSVIGEIAGIFTGVGNFTKAGKLTARRGTSAVGKASTGIFETAGELASGLIAINTKQDVFAMEQAKDRAMQQIQFNDIKTSPSAYDNLTSPVTARFNAVYYPLCVYLYTARNIDDVKKYHEIFGYEINKPLNNFSFTTIKNHENFDYISFVSLFIHANIPRDMEETIEQILTNGVRFWYDYTKFLDYSLPNNEVS